MDIMRVKDQVEQLDTTNRFKLLILAQHTTLRTRALRLKTN